MSVRKFLELAHEQWPTDRPMHNITLADKPNDLSITIFAGDLWHTFYVTEDELDDSEGLTRQMNGHIEKALAEYKP